MKVNGKMYDWGSVDLKLPDVSVEAQSVDYDDELEKELVYGKGNKPRGWGTGNYKANAKITFSKEDFDEITEYCKKKNIPLYKLFFPRIIISYADDNQRVVSDELNKVSFSKIAHKLAQGDKGIKVDVDLFVAGLVVRNGVQPI